MGKKCVKLYNKGRKDFMGKVCKQKRRTRYNQLNNDSGHKHFKGKRIRGDKCFKTVDTNVSGEYAQEIQWNGVKGSPTHKSTETVGTSTSYGYTERKIQTIQRAW